MWKISTNAVFQRKKYQRSIVLTLFIISMLSLNTNLTSLMVQRNLNKATAGLNSAIEQLTTGYKLNRAKDNPANWSMMKQMETKLSSWNVAGENISMGCDMLETASSCADLIYTHITRIRDLCEQSCNGTYGANSINAIKAEIEGRLAEIDRIRSSTEFNGINLFGEKSENGVILDKNINFQVGIDGSESSRITVNTALHLESLEGFDRLDITNPEVLDRIDSIIDDVSAYQVRIGSAQNRLEYALDYVDTMTLNLTSSISTIKDADVAKVSSDLIRYQILQQACATLLATANQQPALALQLL